MTPGLGARQGISLRARASPTCRRSAARRCSTRCCSIRRKLAGAGLSVRDVATALSANNGNAGGGFYSEGGQFYYVRGLGRVATLEDIGNVVLAVQNGTPVLVKDIGDVVIGHAPRLGQFGFNEQNDAVEGIILMRTGEQAQTVLKGVEAKTAELNDDVLPKDVKVRAVLRPQRSHRAHDAYRRRTTCSAASCSSSSC